LASAFLLASVVATSSLKKTFFKGDLPSHVSLAEAERGVSGRIV